MARSRQVPFQPPHSGSCKIAFVAEAPAQEEWLEGLPLVGPSGRCLAQILRTARLAKSCDAHPIPKNFYPQCRSHGLRPMLWERSEFLITNVFDEQLPNNDIGGWCSPVPQSREWANYDLPRIEGKGCLRPEHAGHLTRLATELRKFKPTVIVPFGGTALWAFTGTTDITNSRGAVGSARYIVPGTKLLPTFHPANVVRNWKMFSVVVADCVKAAKEAEFPELRLPKREIWVEPTLEDLYAFKRKYIDAGSGPLSIDIETAAGQLACIGFGRDSEHALVVPFVDYRQPDRSYWPTVEAELAALMFVREVCSSDIPKLLQNGPYDIYWLWDRYGVQVRNYAEDPRLMHHALYQELPKSLAFMGASYGQNMSWKLMRQRRSDKRDE